MLKNVCKLNISYFRKFEIRLYNNKDKYYTLLSFKRANLNKKFAAFDFSSNDKINKYKNKITKIIIYYYSSKKIKCHDWQHKDNNLYIKQFLY